MEIVETRQFGVLEETHELVPFIPFPGTYMICFKQIGFHQENTSLGSAFFTSGSDSILRYFMQTGNFTTNTFGISGEVALITQPDRILITNMTRHNTSVQTILYKLI